MAERTTGWMAAVVLVLVGYGGSCEGGDTQQQPRSPPEQTRSAPTAEQRPGTATAEERTTGTATAEERTKESAAQDTSGDDPAGNPPPSPDQGQNDAQDEPAAPSSAQASCVERCVRDNQVRAVGMEQIRADCRRQCQGKPR